MPGPLVPLLQPPENAKRSAQSDKCQPLRRQPAVTGRPRQLACLNPATANDQQTGGYIE